MQILLFIFAMSLVTSAQAQTRTYNECQNSNRSGSGIYFENGYARPSVNASRHFFERIYFVAGAGQETKSFKVRGDDLYLAQCKALPGATATLNLSQEYYVTYDQNFKCNDKSSIQVKFDLNSNAKPNGFAVIQFPNEEPIRIDLNCGK